MMDVSLDFTNKWFADNAPTMKSSGDTITEFLHHAKKTIDATFGDGYAAKNPVLVGQVVRACNDSLSSASLYSCLMAIDATFNRLPEEIAAFSGEVVE